MEINVGFAPDYAVNEDATGRYKVAGDRISFCDAVDLWWPEISKLQQGDTV
jgi:hypothetical protein